MIHGGWYFGTDHRVGGSRVESRDTWAFPTQGLKHLLVLTGVPWYRYSNDGRATMSGEALETR